MIMTTPFWPKVVQDKAAAHHEQLPILELEEIHPISAVTRYMIGLVTAYSSGSVAVVVFALCCFSGYTSPIPDKEDLTDGFNHQSDGACRHD